MTSFFLSFVYDWAVSVASAFFDYQGLKQLFETTILVHANEKNPSRKKSKQRHKETKLENTLTPTTLRNKVDLIFFLSLEFNNV